MIPRENERACACASLVFSHVFISYARAREQLGAAIRFPLPCVLREGGICKGGAGDVQFASVAVFFTFGALRAAGFDCSD